MRRATVLLVDDMSTIRSLVSNTLKANLGIDNILMAENGEEALGILRTRKVDIILSDWNMPVMDGEELLYEVRQDSMLKDIPFVMMTTNNDRDFIVTAIQLGVTNFLVKPFKPFELEEKLRLAWGYFNRRNEPRQAGLPKHVAQIAVDGKKLEGEFLDLSQTGCLVNLKYDRCLRLFKSCEVNLELLEGPDGESKKQIIPTLTGMIVRLEAEDSFHPTSIRCHMGMYFNPAKMNKEMSEVLRKVLDWLGSRAPDVIG